MAIEFEYIPVSFSEIPVSKIFDIGNDYTFEFIYNKKIDRITMYIKDDDDLVLYSTLIVYGSQLYHAVVSGIELNQYLVAFNISDLLTGFSIESEEVTSSSFGDTVKIYLLDK